MYFQAIFPGASRRLCLTRDIRRRSINCTMMLITTLDAKTIHAFSLLANFGSHRFPILFFKSNHLLWMHTRVEYGFSVIHELRFLYLSFVDKEVLRMRVIFHTVFFLLNLKSNVAGTFVNWWVVVTNLIAKIQCLTIIWLLPSWWHSEPFKKKNNGFGLTR